MVGLFAVGLFAVGDAHARRASTGPGAPCSPWEVKLDLRLRDLKTGETKNEAFDSEEAAKEWCKNRPKFMECLGVASHHVPKPVSDAIRAEYRPLDEEEQKLAEQLDEERKKVMAEQAKKMQQQMQEALLRDQAAEAGADPNRPMELKYTFRQGIGKANPNDPREITPEVLAAVTAWIEERNSWVESRNQCVGDATIRVYPGELPEEGAERVISGRFVPVTAAKKAD